MGLLEIKEHISKTIPAEYALGLSERVIAEIEEKRNNGANYRNKSCEQVRKDYDKILSLGR